MIRRKIEGIFTHYLHAETLWLNGMFDKRDKNNLCLHLKQNIDNIWIHTLYLKPVTFYNHRFFIDISRLHKKCSGYK